MSEETTHFTFYSRENGKDKDGTFWVVFTRSREVTSWKNMISLMKLGTNGGSKKISGVDLYAHGGVAAGSYFFYVGDDMISSNAVKVWGRQLKSVAPYFTKDAIFNLHVCAAGHADSFLTALATESGITFRACRDLQNPNINARPEGPTKLFVPGAKSGKKESKDPWRDENGKRIVKNHWAFI